MRGQLVHVFSVRIVPQEDQEAADGVRAIGHYDRPHVPLALRAVNWHTVTVWLQDVAACNRQK